MVVESFTLTPGRLIFPILVSILKGTVDNGGRILVDGIEKIRGGYFAGAVFPNLLMDL